MLLLADGLLVRAVGDLDNHLACRELTQQRVAFPRGERGEKLLDDLVGSPPRIARFAP